MLLLIFIISPATSVGAEEPVFTEYKSEEAEAYIWNELSKHSPSDVITAGIMGYFWREAKMRSDAIAGWGTILATTGKDLCLEVTKRIDEGLADGSSYDYYILYVRTYGGYGLGQWYARHEIEPLYWFAQDYGTSIGDANMQCAFIFESLQENEDLWALLLSQTDPEMAGRFIGRLYDGSEIGYEYMGWKAARYYEKYHQP